MGPRGLTWLELLSLLFFRARTTNTVAAARTTPAVSKRRQMRRSERDEIAAKEAAPGQCMPCTGSVLASANSHPQEARSHTCLCVAAL